MGYKMEEKENLYIYDSLPENHEEQSIAIEDMISRISRDEYLKIKRELLSLDIEESTPIPLYDSLWKYIMLSYHGSLIENILLYEQLENEISKIEPDQVHINVTEDHHRRVIYDLEKEFDCDFIYSNKAYHSSMRSIPFSIGEILLFCIMLADQLAIIIVKAISGGKKKIQEFESIVFPYPGRDESLRPIVDEMTTETLILVDPGSRTPNLSGYKYPFEWDNYETRSFNSFATIPVIIAQLHLFISLIIETTITKALEHGLTQNINKIRGINMSYTVRFTIQHALRGRLLDFKRAIISRHIFSQVDGVKQVVTGSNGSMYRPIRHFAKEVGLENYYIPHAVAHPVEVEQPPHPETTMIVAGEFDKKVMESNFPNEMLPALVPLGRPYFDGLDTNKENNQNSDGLVVMLATQQLESVRAEFIRDILSELSNIDNINKIIIKIHPAESKSYYSDLCSELDLEITEAVSIHDNNLSYHIQNSDIVFTINSNVGIESMILGTPSVSYNKWRPRIPSYPYATKGPGILLTNVEELCNFVSEIDHARAEELSSKMETFAKGNYEPDADSAKLIAECITS